MSVHDDLGIRMKTFYEQIPKTKLMRRTPVAIRIDGKAFHTFTIGFERPFDDLLVEVMQETTKYLCENIQGCVLGYTQSDEITLILVDYKNLNSAAWFDYEVQKLCSISASMATMAFNNAFENAIYKRRVAYEKAGMMFCQDPMYPYVNKVGKAMFDARCFNIPKEEVTNLIYWRQLDATRNSIQMVGQAYFSHKELHEKSQGQIQDMLFTQRGINWNDYPTHLKRGSCCIKETLTYGGYDDNGNIVNTYVTRRTHWVIDKEIPIFKGEDREYIEKLINFE